MQVEGDEGAVRWKYDHDHYDIRDRDRDGGDRGHEIFHDYVCDHKWSIKFLYTIILLIIYENFVHCSINDP